MAIDVTMKVSESSERVWLTAAARATYAKVMDKIMDQEREMLLKSISKMPKPSPLQPYPADHFYPISTLPSYHMNPAWFGTPARKAPEIKKVIFNAPATIVIWMDNSKTIVKCQSGDTYIPEVGLAMAIVKKVYGNKGNYNNVFRKWVPKSE